MSGCHIEDYKPATRPPIGISTTAELDTGLRSATAQHRTSRTRTPGLCLLTEALHAATEPDNCTVSKSVTSGDLGKQSLPTFQRVTAWGSWNLYSANGQNGSPAVPRRWGVQSCFLKVQSVQTASTRMCPEWEATPSRPGGPLQCPQAQAASRRLCCGLRFPSPVLEVTQRVLGLHLLQGQSRKLVWGMSQMVPTE